MRQGNKNNIEIRYAMREKVNVRYARNTKKNKTDKFVIRTDTECGSELCQNERGTRCLCAFCVALCAMVFDVRAWHLFRQHQTVCANFVSLFRDVGRVLAKNRKVVELMVWENRKSVNETSSRGNVRWFYEWRFCDLWTYPWTFWYLCGAFQEIVKKKDAAPKARPVDEQRVKWKRLHLFSIFIHLIEINSLLAYNHFNYS